MNAETRRLLEELTDRTTQVIRQETSGIRREFRAEMAELREELAEFRQDYVEFRQDYAEFRQEHAEFRQEHAEFRQDYVEFRSEEEMFRLNITDEVRQAHVLIESNRTAIELVAEGVGAANERIDQLRTEMNRRFSEQESLMRSMVGQLAADHGRRIDRLERRAGLH